MSIVQTTSNNKNEISFLGSFFVFRRIRLMISILVVAIKVWFRRLIYGPKLPTWGFMFEFVITVMKGYTSPITMESLPKFRKMVSNTFYSLHHSLQFIPIILPNSDIDGEWVFTNPTDIEHIPETHQGAIPPQFILNRIDSGHPVILYLHGGAYISMSTSTHRILVGRIAKITQGTVISINYKLAPEHPFPYGLIDALHTYKWLVTPRGEGGVGVDPSQLVVAGDSAGGGLAVALVLALLNGPLDPIYRPEEYLPNFSGKEDKDRNTPNHVSLIPNLEKLHLPLPSLVILLSPWTDLELSGQSWKDNEPYCYLYVEPVICQWYAGHHHPLSLKKVPLTNPLISPIHGNFKNFPPLLIQVGEKETLLDDSLGLAKNAKQAGVDVTCEVYQDMVHVFHMFGKFNKNPAKAFESIQQHVKAKVGLKSSVQDVETHSKL